MMTYDDIDNFIFFNAINLLSKKSIAHSGDEEAKELFIYWASDNPDGTFSHLNLELSPQQIYYFAKLNLAELEDKTTRSFLLYVSDYIEQNNDWSVMFNNKYNDTALVELNDYLPQYLDVFNAFISDNNVISNFKAKNLYEAAIEVLLEKKYMPESLSRKGNPYNELKSIMELSGQRVDDFIYELIDEKSKIEETAEIEEIAKSVFEFENINGKDILRIKRNTALVSFYNDDFTHDNYADSFYIDKRNGKLDEGISKFFPSILIPKLENFKSGDIKQTLLDEKYTICFCEPKNNFMPSKTASECYFLKNIKKYASQKYIDVKVGKKEFKNLISVNDIPKIYVSTNNKINEISNGFTLEADERAREQLAILRTLLAIRMELTSYKTIENLDRFDNFLKSKDDSFKLQNDKNIDIDFTDTTITQLFGVSNIEINLIKNRYFDLQKVETDSDLPDFSKSYDEFLDEFLAKNTDSLPFGG